MKSYYAYVRVSTTKQGEHGSSLQEQRDAINLFATRNDLRITSWFEERETAAKIGRREFSRMVAALKRGKASGVIFHKIDRSARNLKDWSAIQDLAELGVDVKFTQESINLGSNEGKLTGDFLAVIAAHYIRNLRDEVRKGIRGRLKQGLYPFRAFIGYLDQGGGRPKVPDPQRAPLIHDAFELYATGRFTLHTLCDELYSRGLRNTSGKKVGPNRLAAILRNPFYIGIIRVKKSGESFMGVHEPIVSKTLFKRVQDVLDGRLSARPRGHDFLFRRMIRCSHCGYSLIGEVQKGHVYYRCHTRSCPPTSFREEAVDIAIRQCLTPLNLLEAEAAELRQRAVAMRDQGQKHRQDMLRAIDLRIEVISGRLSRLTDMYLDGSIDHRAFEEKKLSLMMERSDLEKERLRIDAGEDVLADRLLKYLELLDNVALSYEMANPVEKRKLVSIITSNLHAHGKDLAIELKSPFGDIKSDQVVRFGGPYRGEPRTRRLRNIFNLLVRHCKSADEERELEDVPLAA